MASITCLLLISILFAHLAPILHAYSLEGYVDKSLSSYLPSNPKRILNVIDSCWRTKPHWATNRYALTDCAVGFGKAAMGGKYGPIYVVTTPFDDPVNPKPGTLRYGVIQMNPLWIIFANDMVINLKNELIVNSYKTIDGRGAAVEIAHGPCITVQDVSHVIIHGISIHDCKPGKPGLVRSSPTHVGHRGGSDGDAISIFASSNIWIDHCYLARCTDGLIDVIRASTAVTISNNYFAQHDKVMLLGASDEFTADKSMKVTVVLNRFGEGLTERMPRVRLGYAHVANNRYDEWSMYAIGGSANPTIFSEGNYFIAPNSPDSKEVTKREASGWKHWNWRTSRDVFQNGAYFVPSGYGTCAPFYTRTQRFIVADGSMVPSLTLNAGPLSCVIGKPC
ncbi:Pec_lyase_C domain-containing protein [Cephalotus follicularis]|uniref:Pectate lyase n=1 Tax=Cephalotus follicularis TaxID=3775 RepID=A0A1Q3BYX6_CEPFO|nr:Pec_lyase_C domain-containing protein [Cephalotus follicularis]